MDFTLFSPSISKITKIVIKSNTINMFITHKIEYKFLINTTLSIFITTSFIYFFQIALKGSRI